VTSIASARQSRYSFPSCGSAPPAMRIGGSLHSCVCAEKCGSPQSRAIPRRHASALLRPTGSGGGFSPVPNGVTQGLHAQDEREASWTNWRPRHGRQYGVGSSRSRRIHQPDGRRFKDKVMESISCHRPQAPHGHVIDDGAARSASGGRVAREQDAGRAGRI
jgi:hypothetical protein